jgi:hypothetical protein
MASLMIPGKAITNNMPKRSPIIYLALLCDDFEGCSFLKQPQLIVLPEIKFDRITLFLLPQEHLQTK